MWPRGKQNRARDLLLFKYFLNNLILTVFMQNTLSKFAELMQYKNEWLMITKNAGTVLCSSLLEMCVQSLKLIVWAVFVLELVMCSPPKNVSLVKVL